MNRRQYLDNWFKCTKCDVIASNLTNKKNYKSNCCQSTIKIKCYKCHNEISPKCISKHHKLSCKGKILGLARKVVQEIQTQNFPTKIIESTSNSNTFHTIKNGLKISDILTCEEEINPLDHVEFVQNSLNLITQIPDKIFVKEIMKNVNLCSYLDKEN
jgi:hypothetical protein